MVAGNDILTAKTPDPAARFAHLIPPQEEASTLTVACRPDDYSASALAHAVEDSNAHLINLNVTDIRLDDGRITVELRTNRRHTASCIRSLERYGFEVIGLDAAGLDDDESSATLRSRAAELIHLLEI